MIERLGHFVVDHDGQGIEDAIPTHLLPLAAPDIVDQLARNPRLLEQIRDGQQTSTLMPHQLPDRHRSPLIMVDDAGLRDLGVDVRDTTDDTIPLNARQDAIFRIDSILQGQDDGPIGQDRLDLGQHLIQIVGFHGEDNQVRFREDLADRTRPADGR